MDRIILHSDLNNFFASVECAKKPELKEKPMAVCGSENDRHGIVLAKNQIAKLYGIKTGDTVWQARKKCSDLFVINPHFEDYAKFSAVVRNIYCDYTDQVEPFGMDECWLDVTHSTLLFGNGKTIADDIRNRVKRETGLTVSVGVSFNKIFAKLCSDMKKPDATTEILRGDMREKIWPLPANALLGVGKSSEKILLRHGIRTIGDIARLPCEYLKNWLGKGGEELHMYANGLDYSRVSPCNYERKAQSVSHGVTCKSDLVDNCEVSRLILYLSEDISCSLRKSGFLAKGLAVDVRSSNLSHSEFSVKFLHPTRSARIIFEHAFEIFKNCYDWKNDIRSVTLRAFDLTEDSEPIVIDLFTNAVREDKFEKKEACADSIRSRFGKGSIIPASLMTDFKLPSILNESMFPRSPLI